MLRSVQCTVIAQMDGSRKSTVGRVAGAEPCGRHSLTKVLETVAQAGEGRQRRGEMCRPKQAVHMRVKIEADGRSLTCSEQVRYQDPCLQRVYLWLGKGQRENGK